MKPVKSPFFEDVKNIHESSSRNTKAKINTIFEREKADNKEELSDRNDIFIWVRLQSFDEGTERSTNPQISIRRGC